MSNARETDRAQARRQRWILPVLAVLFLGPLAVAWALYFMGNGWKPGEQVNHGELLAAPVSLSAGKLRDPYGVPLGDALFGEKWSLLHLRDAACDPACRASLDKAVRVRLALREKSIRVQNVLLHDAAAEVIVAEAPAGITVVPVGADGFAMLMQEISLARGGRGLHAGGVCLVDPLGNLIMVYEADFEMKGMLADLKRLLKLSRIG